MLKVTKRKDRKGLWITGTVAGIRIRESAGTDNRALAEEKRAKRESELIRTSLYGAEEETTFAQAAVLYMQAGHSHLFLKPLIERVGERRLSSFKPGEVRDLAITIYPNGSPATRNRQGLTPFLAVLNFACDRGLARPLRVKRFKETKATRVAIGRDWIDQFRSHCDKPAVSALALYMFTTGARLGEALDLKPGDFDASARVARSYATKNGDPHDYLLTEEVAAELDRLTPRNGRLFGYASKRHVYAAWRKACAAAGIAYVPPHQAGRHSFATKLIVEDGVDVATVAGLANWKSKKLLLDRYTHAAPNRAVIDRAFGTTPVLKLVKGSGPK